MYAEQGEGSNGWQGAGEGGSNGWSMGLEQQPLPMQARRGLGEAPAFLISTPSITSESSSDLDTESTGSFFPEKSTTLGSLIGLQSSSRADQSHPLVPARGTILGSERHKSTGSAATASTSNSRFRTTWCPTFGCSWGSSREALGMSPSLAHLFAEERKTSGAQRQASNEEGVEQTEYYDREGCVGTPSLLAHTNTLFDEEGILAPHPSGAPLKLISQHTSPSSSYLSADWNVFNGRHPHHDRGGGGGGPSHAKLSTFWPNLCGSLAQG